MKLTYSQLKVFFFFCFSSLVVIAFIAFSGIEEYRERYTWVNHTNNVLIHLHKVYSDFEDAESRVRGYVISGDSSLLLSYKSSHASILTEHKALLDLTKDNPVQRQNLRRLKIILDEKFSHLEAQVHNENNSRSAPFVRKGEGMTQRVRNLMHSMEQEENRLLLIRSQKLSNTESGMIYFVLLGGVLSLIGMGGLCFLMFREIGQRMEVERDLLEKDKTIEKIKEFEFLSNSLPQIIWTATPDGDVDYCNNHWYDYTGMTYEETKEWGWKLAVHPEDLQTAVEVWGESVRTGKDYEVEYRFKRASDGTYRWHLGRALPMRDEEGKIVKWFGTCTDIQDQKEIEEKLRQTSESYSLLINGVKDYAIFLLDREGRVASWNSGAEKIKGYTADEIIGKHYHFFYPEHRRGSEDPEQEFNIAKTEGRFEEEGWRRRKDGTLFWANVTLTALYNSENALVGYSTIVRDLTEKKNAEEKLREQNEELLEFRQLAIDEMQNKTQMLNAILSNMPVSLFRVNSDGMLTESIGRAWKRPPVKGKSIYAMFPEWKQVIAQVLRGESCTVLVSGVENGEEWYIENYLFPDNVQNEGVIGFALDVTEKKTAEKRIAESEEKFRGLLEAAPDSMVIVNQEGRIDLVNAQTLKLFGYGPQELAGARIEQLIPQRFLIDHEMHRTSYLANPSQRSMGQNLELYGKRKDGTEFPVEISLSPLKTKDGILISAAIRDITVRKEAEQELEKAKIAAENANNFKSRFLANMSHEIRTPLNAIIGFAEVMEKQSLSREQQSEYLNYITSSGNLLLKLIGDILDISKIEEGKIELVKETFFFKEVLSSGILPYKYKANEKGLDFELRYDEHIPHYVIGDPYRIKQMIINLIGNAMKFTKEGKVIIDISNLSEEKLQDEVVLKISVSDSGIGIPADKQAAIFDSFIQADNSILREYGGSGLGLSIVKQLVTLMDGTIGVQSPSNTGAGGGPGTTIWFTVKLSVDKTHVKPVVSLDENKKTDFKLDPDLNILIVEDNLVNQRLAKVVLKKMGCVPDFAVNGKEGVEMVASKKYSIVLMDVQMPVMDGFEATKIIRQSLKSDIPIIGLTANVFKEDIENCRKAGMNDYLGKPYSEEQIYNMITKWTRSVV